MIIVTSRNNGIVGELKYANTLSVFYRNNFVMQIIKPFIFSFKLMNLILIESYLL
ncbi:MAG: hypothetical protein Nk1A_5530 [Endomicrobiia bacterium]|nr:MAG: hypothetical protein Nk1A_5530 [Endomicrobiia bacterium]